MYDRFLDPPFVTPFLIYRSLTNAFSFLYTSAFVHLSLLTSVLLTCPFASRTNALVNKSQNQTHPLVAGGWVQKQILHERWSLLFK